MAILLITLAVVLRTKINPGLLGLALVNMMDLSQSLTSLITSWTSLETSLGAIARIKEFSEDTPCENLDGENVIPSLEWPADGALSFEGVSAQYRYFTPHFARSCWLINLSNSANGPPILNDINLIIRPGEKIGICGRTGRYVLFTPTAHCSYVRN